MGLEREWCEEVDWLLLIMTEFGVAAMSICVAELIVSF